MGQISLSHISHKYQYASFFQSHNNEARVKGPSSMTQNALLSVVQCCYELVNLMAE